MTRPELRALTGMRGVAAWFVVLYHIRQSIAGLPPVVGDVLAKGYLAVDFFFLLSGFVIWLAWGERLRGGGMAAVPPFLTKRIARIWPLHLVMLAGAATLAGLLVATGRADPAEFPLAELPLHVALVQNWGFTDDLAWNDPAWSISAELAAYLLFPVLALSIDWRRLPTAALLAIGATLLLALHLAMRGAPTLGTDIPRFGLVRCLMEFATGTIVGALWWHGSKPLPALALAAALLAGWAIGLPETLVVPGAFAALLLALAAGAGLRGNPLETRAVHYLGEISYATYLGHFLLWKGFKLAFVRDVAAVSPGLIALYLLLVLASSIALYHLVERPAQRRINALRLPAFNRPARRRAPPPAPR